MAMCHQHFREEHCFLARVLRRNTSLDLAWKVVSGGDMARKTGHCPLLETRDVPTQVIGTETLQGSR